MTGWDQNPISRPQEMHLWLFAAAWRFGPHLPTDFGSRAASEKEARVRMDGPGYRR